jgi:hypothetical protein
MKRCTTVTASAAPLKAAEEGVRGDHDQHNDLCSLQLGMPYHPLTARSPLICTR